MSASNTRNVKKPNTFYVNRPYIKADYKQVLNGDTSYGMRKGKEQNSSK
jgi:hypothetical protein